MVVVVVEMVIVVVDQRKDTSLYSSQKWIRHKWRKRWSERTGEEFLGGARESNSHAKKAQAQRGFLCTLVTLIEVQCYCQW